MDKKGYVEIVFDEAKHDMRNYFTTLSSKDTKFNQFELQYDNSIHSLILFIENNDGTFNELDRWGSFNLTMFKQLISLGNNFSKSDKFELWDAIPIKLSMLV